MQKDGYFLIYTIKKRICFNKKNDLAQQYFKGRKKEFNL